MEYIFIIIIVMAVIIAIGVFLYLQNNIIDITKYNLKYDKADEPIRIMQLSDLHSKPFKKVLKKIDEIKPDIICITGDYINDREKNKKKMLKYAKALVARAKVYYITGNHERRLENFDELMDELSKVGFIVLLNRVSIYNDKGFEIDFLGLDENQANFDDYKARKKG